jgi:hypothetical protein
MYWHIRQHAEPHDAGDYVEDGGIPNILWFFSVSSKMSETVAQKDSYFCNLAAVCDLRHCASKTRNKKVIQV